MYRDRLDFLFVRVSLGIHFRLIHRLKCRIPLPLLSPAAAPSSVVVPAVVVLVEMTMAMKKSPVPVMAVEECWWWGFGNRLAFTGETRHTPVFSAKG